MEEIDLTLHEEILDPIKPIGIKVAKPDIWNKIRLAYAYMEDNFESDEEILHDFWGTSRTIDKMAKETRIPGTDTEIPRLTFKAKFDRFAFMKEFQRKRIKRVHRECGVIHVICEDGIKAILQDTPNPPNETGEKPEPPSSISPLSLHLRRQKEIDAWCEVGSGESDQHFIHVVSECKRRLDKWDAENNNEQQRAIIVGRILALVDKFRKDPDVLPTQLRGWLATLK